MDNNDLVVRINKEVEVYCELIKNIDFITISLGQICRKAKNVDKMGKNDYSSLSKAKDKQGLYIFYNKEEVLYVGESHKVNKKWDLLKRIKQHFRIGDKGGLLYNICKGNKVEALKLRNKFIDNKVNVTFFIFNDIKIARYILFIESYLIGVLKPKYNFEKKTIQKEH